MNSFGPGQTAHVAAKHTACRCEALERIPGLLALTLNLLVEKIPGTLLSEVAMVRGGRYSPPLAAICMTWKRPPLGLGDSRIWISVSIGESGSPSALSQPNKHKLHKSLKLKIPEKGVSTQNYGGCGCKVRRVRWSPCTCMAARKYHKIWKRGPPLWMTLCTRTTHNDPLGLAACKQQRRSHTEPYCNFRGASAARNWSVASCFKAPRA